MGKLSANKRKPKRDGTKVKVGQVGALPEGRGATVQLKDGTEVALFNVGPLRPVFDNWQDTYIAFLQYLSDILE